MPKNEDNMYYLGNKNLPNVRWKGEYTKEQVKELKKASSNILHFAENYFYIIDLDKGKTCIKLYGAQKRALRKMRDNRFFCLLASRQIGKALDLNTPVHTPLGYTTMGELKDGDIIYGSDGEETKVVKAHDVLYDRECYKLTFDNGETIVADGEHLWYTETGKGAGSVKTTKEIYDTVSDGHIIPTRDESTDHHIICVETTKSVPVRCITVDSDDSLFLVGKSRIPTHNSTMMTIYILWQACFNSDQRILLVANKESTAIEIFQRVRMAYEELPNWIKPPVREYAKTSMTLENGSRIGITTTTGTAARGQTVNCLVIDELAHVEPHLMDEFWKAVFPIISSSKKSKVFVCSTANGTDNLFYKLYSGAETGQNGWAHDKIMWYEVPGRDEKWAEETKQAIGSHDAWQQEFQSCSGDSLVNIEDRGNIRIEDLYNELK